MRTPAHRGDAETRREERGGSRGKESVKKRFVLEIENSDISAEALEEMIADAMDGEPAVREGPIVVSVEDAEA